MPCSTHCVSHARVSQLSAGSGLACHLAAVSQSMQQSQQPLTSDLCAQGESTSATTSPRAAFTRNSMFGSAGRLITRSISHPAEDLRAAAAGVPQACSAQSTANCTLVAFQLSVRPSLLQSEPAAYGHRALASCFDHTYSHSLK